MSTMHAQQTIAKDIVSAAPSGVGVVINLTRREIIRIVRQPSRLIASIATPVLIWVLLGSGFANSFKPPSEQLAQAGASYGLYLLPGMLTMTVLFSSIFGAISLIEDRHEGFLQSVLVSPAPRWALGLAKLLGTSLLATAQAAVLLPAAYVLGDPVSVLHLGLILGALLCVSFGVAGIGLAAAWWVDSTQGFHGVMNLVLLPMWLLSGSVFPLAGASGPMKLLMMANPVTWCTQALLGALELDHANMALAWSVTIGFGIFGIVLSWITLGRGVKRA